MIKNVYLCAAIFSSIPPQNFSFLIAACLHNGQLKVMIQLVGDPVSNDDSTWNVDDYQHAYLSANFCRWNLKAF